MSKVNRRDFAKLAASLSGGVLSLPAPVRADVQAQTRGFPKGFLWGSATASFQVEGALREDERGASIWDVFSREPGKIKNGDTAEITTDSYHRYREDIAVMKDLGLNAARFSIAWSRIFPSGSGQPNQKGIDHYRKFVDALRKEGIQPVCTLYHWDLPQTLQEAGGWESKDTAYRFADYAGFMASKLGDIVSMWITMNEMNSFIGSGYGTGRHAPGLKLPPGRLAQAKHHAVLGHGLGVQAIRSSVNAHASIGSADGVKTIVPAFDATEHVEAARKAFVEENAPYLTVLHTGRYTDQYLQSLGADAPVFTEEELKIISTATDFQGLNVYESDAVRAADTPQGYAIMPRPASYPHMASPWLWVGPEALYWVPKLASETLGIRRMYITENGTSCDDTVADDGEVYDTDRVMYLNAYLTQLQRAVEEGVPVEGYFLWSLLDNFEWAEGFSKRFGITYVDFKTQKRTPKLSAKFYKNLIARGRC